MGHRLRACVDVLGQGVLLRATLHQVSAPRPGPPLTVHLHLDPSAGGLGWLQRSALALGSSKPFSLRGRAVLGKVGDWPGGQAAGCDVPASRQDSLGPCPRERRYRSPPHRLTDLLRSSFLSPDPMRPWLLCLGAHDHPRTMQWPEHDLWT